MCLNLPPPSSRSRKRKPPTSQQPKLPPQHIHTSVMSPTTSSPSTTAPTGSQMPQTARRTKKTRFVCMADTHNLSPFNGAFKVPKADVLVHAGDMTKQGTYEELRKTVAWIEKLVKDGVVEKAIIIAGNHELTLDPPFYASHGHNWHNQYPQSPTSCLSLFSPPSLHPSITFLNHTSSHIILTSPTGPQTHFTVFGSPYTPVHSTKHPGETDSPRWAFQYDSHPSNESERIWEGIPNGIDVLVTHGPPYGHLDGSTMGVGKGLAAQHTGCEALREAVWRSRPKLHVFGHIHEARGAERVMWRDGKHVSGMEEGCACSVNDEVDDSSSLPSRSVVTNSTGIGGMDSNRTEGLEEGAETVETYTHDHAQMQWIDPGAVDDRISGKMSVVDVTGRTRMFGGVGLRDGETLMVNGAIMRGGWPYKGMNKVVVVDLDLEIWEGES
ncbi:hypothetical protein ABW19_dt0202890 [Dactylella cylindrospora]|nr:hypothetical protein ABW19_dt0202890 [Dactylella cylindrospora]